jgi:hypothetical protein
MDTRTHLAARVADIAPFHVMEVQTAARALEAAGRSVVHMEIGEPDFPTPDPVLDAARRRWRTAASTTRPRSGCPRCAPRSRAHYGDHYGVDVSPERVIVTAGSSAALLLVTALLVNRDEQILMADPGYPCNRHFVRTLEGEPVGVPVDASTRYQLTADLVARRGDRDARRADRLAVQPDRHDGRARRARAHRGRGRRARGTAHRRRDLPRPVLRPRPGASRERARAVATTCS